MFPKLITFKINFNVSENRLVVKIDDIFETKVTVNSVR